MIKKIKDSLLPLTLIFLLPSIYIIYFYLNNSQRVVHLLVTDLDKAVPFIKLFAIPYLSWYPFLTLTLVYFCINHRKIYYKVILNLLVGMCICFIIYYFYQTTVPRPILYGDDLFTKLVGFIYSTDNQFNCFPSIHVLTCYIIIRGVKDCEEKSWGLKVIIILVGISIILSTQFIKQHVILDLIFAILLGSGIYKIIDKLNFERSLLWIKKQYWWLMTKKKLEI